MLALTGCMQTGKSGKIRVFFFKNLHTPCQSKVAGAIEASSYLYGLVRFINLDFFTFIIFCVTRIRLYRGEMGGKAEAYF